jgi:hypothetical protein
MSVIKVISEYIGEETNRSASVYKDLETKEYKVSLRNESGSYFSTTFETVDAAEDYAESWVMNK